MTTPLLFTQHCDGAANNACKPERDMDPYDHSDKDRIGRRNLDT
jgi:hypothetical protein